jgi:hypothetical protein
VALPACGGPAGAARVITKYAFASLGRRYRACSKSAAPCPTRFFDQVLLDATIRSRRLIAAQRMLELRRQWEPDGVPFNAPHWHSCMAALELALRRRGPPNG